MNENLKVEFIPFHAINEFMRSDFRLKIIRVTLLELPQLDRKFRTSLDRLTRKYVKVAGFRNCLKAPISLKSVAMAKPFANQPDLVAAILSAWSAANFELQNGIFVLLTHKNWKLLPIDTDRTKLPGFLTTWPVEDDYEDIYQDFVADYPDIAVSIDETSLMAIWLSGRLPIDKVSKEEMFAFDENDPSDISAKTKPE